MYCITEVCLIALVFFYAPKGQRAALLPSMQASKHLSMFVWLLKSLCWTLCPPTKQLKADEAQQALVSKGMCAQVEFEERGLPLQQNLKLWWDEHTKKTMCFKPQ